MSMASLEYLVHSPLVSLDFLEAGKLKIKNWELENTVT